MDIANERLELPHAARILVAELFCVFMPLPSQADDLDAWLDLGVLLCHALPDADKAQLRIHLLARWAANPPAWAAKVLQALQGPQLDTDVWADFLDTLPEA